MAASFIRLSLTNPLWPEQFERDCGGAEASRLGGDDDFSLVIFGRTHAAHYFAGRHPLCCQHAVMAADGQTWEVKRVRVIHTHTHTGGEQINISASKQTHTGTLVCGRMEELAQTAMPSIKKFSQTVTGGRSSSWGHSWGGWPWSSYVSLNCLNLMWATPRC